MQDALYISTADGNRPKYDFLISVAKNASITELFSKCTEIVDNASVPYEDGAKNYSFNLISIHFNGKQKIILPSNGKSYDYYNYVELCKTAMQLIAEVKNAETAALNTECSSRERPIKNLE